MHRVCLGALKVVAPCVRRELLIALAVHAERMIRGLGTGGRCVVGRGEGGSHNTVAGTTNFG